MGGPNSEKLPEPKPYNLQKEIRMFVTQEGGSHDVAWAHANEHPAVLLPVLCTRWAWEGLSLEGHASQNWKCQVVVLCATEADSGLKGLFVEKGSMSSTPECALLDFSASSTSLNGQWAQSTLWTSLSLMGNTWPRGGVGGEGC